MLDMDGSDLHLAVGMPPRVRASGSIMDMEDEPELDQQSLEEMLQEICNETRWNHFQENYDPDLAHEIPGLARFRGSFLYNQWWSGAVFRQIPAEILSFDKLNLPEILKEVYGYQEGLVLVTGPTGSGKSTTMAAMLDYINDNYQKHIITIEDPIEFVHPKKNCVIVHREVGEHSHSFANALRSSMRGDPDIILLDEMRELETIQLALGCASMGMLVFGTLHTNNAPKTVDRIIDAFPAEEQNQIRTMLASCLRGVVSQLLCKKVGGGRVAVNEILLKHDALPNCISSGKISNIRGIIESSMAQGMTTMDASLMAQLKKGAISDHEAYMKAADKNQFESYKNS
jgi:twitching motility protein PilT